MEEEIWKPLVYHGEYFGDTHEISNLGRIRNINRNIIMRPFFGHGGYLQVKIRSHGKRTHIKIHRAVAENFVDGDHNLTVNHKDLNKQNNRWDNLEFITMQKNKEHAAINGAIKHYFSEDDLKKIIQLRKDGLTYQRIGEIVGCSKYTIKDFMRRQTYKQFQYLLDT